MKKCANKLRVCRIKSEIIYLEKMHIEKPEREVVTVASAGVCVYFITVLTVYILNEPLEICSRQ